MKKLSSTDPLALFGVRKYAIQCDKFDIEDFEEILNSSRDLLKMKKAGTTELPTFPELMQDMYDMLFKPKPKMEEEHAIDSKALFNYMLMQQLIENRRVKEIRTVSQLDNLASAIGVESLSEEVTEIIKHMKEQQEAVKQYIEAAQEAQDAADAAAKAAAQVASQGQGDEEGEQVPGQATPEDITLQDAKKRLEEAKQQMQESFKDANLQHNITQMLGKVKNKTIETSKTLKTWGLGGDATFQKTPYRQKLDITNKLLNSSKLKRIAEIAGKLTAIAMSQQTQKVKRGTEEVYNVEFGNDIARILPQELTKLYDPHTRIEFIKNFTEGTCQQYALKGKEKKAKGAIVVCIDESGSMQGEQDIWAKAVAIALLHIAVKQKRSFHVVHFNGSRDAKRLPTHSFPKNEPLNAVKLVEMAEMFMDGGTDFETPLTKARQCIEKEPDFHKADIIFITDGECAVTDGWLKDFNKWRKEKSVSLYSILINCGYNSDASLREFSTTVYSLDNITSKNTDEAALDLFIQV